MAALGTKLRTLEGGALAYWCPGCALPHCVYVDAPNPRNGSRWTWDGNVEAPTFKPSVHYPGYCHSFVTAGRVQFLNDCAHELAGQTVPLPEFP